MRESLGKGRGHNKNRNAASSVNNKSSATAFIIMGETLALDSPGLLVARPRRPLATAHYGVP